MRSIYTLILMCTIHCFAMENQLSSDEKQPLKKQKIISTKNSNIVTDCKTSVPEIIAKIYTAVEQKEASEAANWYARLSEKIYVDWKFLNGEQIAAYVSLDCAMFEKIHAIQSTAIKRLPPSEQEALYKPQALEWIRQAVEINTDTTLDWRAAFGSSELNKPIPSPSSLRRYRLEQFDKIGTLQTDDLKL